MTGASLSPGHRIGLWKKLTCICVSLNDCRVKSSQLLLTSGLPRSTRALSSERGDVPGWVLITLMTAGLVIIIWGLAGPALSSVFEQAIDRVTGF